MKNRGSMCKKQLIAGDKSPQSDSRPQRQTGGVQRKRYSEFPQAAAPVGMPDGDNNELVLEQLTVYERQIVNRTLLVLRGDPNCAEYLTWWLGEYGSGDASARARCCPILPDEAVPLTETELDLLDAQLSAGHNLSTLIH